MPKAFISHSKYDKEFCNAFDNACSTVGLQRFRSEFEDIGKPSWKTINAEIKTSNVLFVLIGEQLRNRQRTALIDSPEYTDWLFTQNWISYEIGVASQKKIDVWVISDSPEINFPVIYFNYYYLWNGHLENPEDRQIYNILRAYKDGKVLEYNPPVDFTCPNCGTTYKIPESLSKGLRIRCPSCLRTLFFKNGWLLNQNKQISLKEKIVKIMNSKVVIGVELPEEK